LIDTAITAGASRVASGLLCVHAIAITPAGPMELVRSSVSIDCGLPCVKARSAPAIIFSGPAQRLLTLWPARSRNRHATLSIESSDSFVASAAASIATGWSEPVPGRELHPLKSKRLSRRTLTSTTPRFPSFEMPTTRPNRYHALSTPSVCRTHSTLEWSFPVVVGGRLPAPELRARQNAPCGGPLRCTKTAPYKLVRRLQRPHSTRAPRHDRRHGRIRHFEKSHHLPRAILAKPFTEMPSATTHRRAPVQKPRSFRLTPHPRAWT
jgi:hypothetical protein